MGDHYTETLELQSRRDEEKHACEQLLGRQDIYLDKMSIPWILNHTDYFVSQCLINKSVKEVKLFPHVYPLDGQDQDVWDKLGQAIGNLQVLKILWLSSHYGTNGYDNGQVLPTPDWGELACILSHVRQKVRVKIDDSYHWEAGEMQALARAIHGHPSIISFDSSRNCSPSYESLDSLYSALATLPALESIRVCNGGLHTRAEDESALAHPESLTELLRLPSMRIVSFDSFDFTPALCRATASVLTGGKAIPRLELQRCSFSSEGSGTILASALSTNSSVTFINVVLCNNARALFDALAAVLPSNSTLRHLELLNRQENYGTPHCLSSVFLALGRNTGLKTLRVAVCESIDESLCTVINNGLGMNKTLESLELNRVHLTDDNFDLWHRALSFLRTDKALKSLKSSLWNRM